MYSMKGGDNAEYENGRKEREEEKERERDHLETSKEMSMIQGPSTKNRVRK